MAALDPTTKLARVRAAMAKGDWEKAIQLAAKLRSLGKYQSVIDRAHEFMSHPKLFEQMGYDRKKVIDDAIAALQEKYSKSWTEVQNEMVTTKNRDEDVSASPKATQKGNFKR